MSPRVDLRAAHRVGLVGHAQVDPVDGRQRSVQLRCGRGAGPDADAEPLPTGGRVGDSADQRGRHLLRVPGASEPAHPDVVARSDESCGLIGRHQPVIERLAPRSRSVRHPCAPARARSRAGPRSGHPGPAGASGAGALGRAGCDHPTLLRGRGRPAPSPGRAASPGIRGTGSWPPPPGPQPRVPRRRERRAQGRSRCAQRTRAPMSDSRTRGAGPPCGLSMHASPDAVLDTRDVSPRSGAARRLLPSPTYALAQPETMTPRTSAR